MAASDGALEPVPVTGPHALPRNPPRPGLPGPVCPDPNDRRTLFSLLDVPSNAGVTLTES